MKHSCMFFVVALSLYGFVDSKRTVQSKEMAVESNLNTSLAEEDMEESEFLDAESPKKPREYKYAPFPFEVDDRKNLEEGNVYATDCQKWLEEGNVYATSAIPPKGAISGLCHTCPETCKALRAKANEKGCKPFTETKAFPLKRMSKKDLDAQNFDDVSSHEDAMKTASQTKFPCEPGSTDCPKAFCSPVRMARCPLLCLCLWPRLNPMWFSAGNEEKGSLNDGKPCSPLSHWIPDNA